MHKNRKAQTTIGQMVVGLILFAFIMMGAFNFFFWHMGENDISMGETVNQTAFQETFGTSNGGGIADNFSELANETYEERNSLLEAVGLDFIGIGIDSLKAAFKSVGFAYEYWSFTRSNTVLGQILPSPFWTLLIATFTIVLTLVVLGALWRYPLTK